MDSAIFGYFGKCQQVRTHLTGVPIRKVGSILLTTLIFILWLTGTQLGRRIAVSTADQDAPTSALLIISIIFVLG